MRKAIIKFVYALALLFVAGMPAETSAQFINPGFESGNFGGWTVTSNSSVTTGFNQQSWLVTPANTRMARIEPASGTTRSTTETFLGLTAGALTNMNASVLNGSTNFGSIKQTVFLGAGQTVTAYWNYVSQDYSPYNDGVFASLVGPGYQQLKLLAVTVNAFGYPGTIVTGSYGSTGWHTVTFTAGVAGTYTLGLGCFNYSDQAVNAILFVDDAAGGTSAPGQPVVTTAAVTSITGSSAVTGGTVTNDGGATVTARGVVYGTSPVPTLANNVITNGNGLGSFTSTLSGLSNSTTYYVRSYASNSAGTSYGNEVSFTTPSSCIPTSFTSCQSNLTANTNSNSCDATVSYTTVASNAPSYSYTFSGATTGSGAGTGSGSTFNKGVTTVSVTATNACGTDQCSFTVTVSDATNPVLSMVPADATVNCQDDNSTSALGMATATDNCGTANVTSSDASTQDADPNSAAHYNYVITRTWTATDASNNSVSADQIITVQDITNPGIAVPQNVTVNCQDDNTPAGTGTATGSDNCSAATISFSDASTQDANPNNSGHYNYVITRTWTATDASSNSVSADQIITVQDVTNPGITAPQDITVNCQDDNTPTGTGTATGTDNCSPVAISFSDVSTQNASNTSIAHYNYTITRTWTATDATGNNTSASQVITVQDITAPSISCPANATVSCKTSVADNGSATGTDNCSPVTITHSDVSTQNANPANSGHYNYTITRTWTATDVTGNYTTCDQVITVSALNNTATTVTPVNTINAKHQNHTIYLGYGPQSVTLSCAAQGGVGAHTYSWAPITGCAAPYSATTSVSPLTSTTYTVIITDGTGCSIAQSTPIQVIDVRCGNKVKICHYPPGNPGNAQQQCLPASAIAAHLAHGCVLGDCPQNKNSGYDNEEEDNHGVAAMEVTDVKVYPNPNTGAFTVELPAGMDKSEVVITDMAGRIIQKQSALEGNKLQFDLGSVARGVYMLHLTNGSQNFRTRISVQ